MTRSAGVATILLLGASLAWGAEPAVPQRTPESPVEPRAIRAVEPRNLSPMHREILESVELERARVEELNLRFARAVVLSEKLSIQREIEAIKLGGQVRVLEIQLRYARAAGRSDVVSQLEASIESIRNPKEIERPEKPVPGR